MVRDEPRQIDADSRDVGTYPPIDVVELEFCNCDTNPAFSEFVYKFPSGDESVYRMCSRCGGIVDWDFPDMSVSDAKRVASLDSIREVAHDLALVEQKLMKRERLANKRQVRLNERKERLEERVERYEKEIEKAKEWEEASESIKANIDRLIYQNERLERYLDNSQ